MIRTLLKTARTRLGSFLDATDNVVSSVIFNINHRGTMLDDLQKGNRLRASFNALLNEAYDVDGSSEPKDITADKIGEMTSRLYFLLLTGMITNDGFPMFHVAKLKPIVTLQKQYKDHACFILTDSPLKQTHVVFKFYIGSDSICSPQLDKLRLVSVRRTVGYQITPMARQAFQVVETSLVGGMEVCKTIPNDGVTFALALFHGLQGNAFYFKTLKAFSDKTGLGLRQHHYSRKHLPTM